MYYKPARLLKCVPVAIKVLENHEVRKICNDNEVYVIQTPIQSGYKKGGYPVKLTIDYKSQLSRGKEIYEQNSDELKDKIDEVYRYIYDNNLK